MSLPRRTVFRPAVRGASHRAILAAPAVLLALCSCLSLRFAYGDIWASTRTVRGLRKAIAVIPWNADYHRLLATALEWEGGEAQPALEEATRLNPRAAAVWIRMAQSEERHGRTAQAEGYLLQAAAVDHTFDPRWTLANYYYRNENFARFWYWVGLALERTYGDGRALFELCSRAPDGKARLHSLIPPDAASLSRYLTYLLSDGYLEPLAETAYRLAAFGRVDDRAILLAACDRLIATERWREAQQLWATLKQSGLIVSPKNTDNLVNNGDFSRTLVEAGFDWRRGDCPGVSVSAIPQQVGLKLELDSAIPDRCELISQYVIVPEARSLGFQAEFRAEPDDIRPFMWSACDVANCRPAEGVRTSRLGDGWARLDGQLRPAESGLIRLVFAYQRPIGSTRYQGELRLRKVKLVRQ